MHSNGVHSHQHIHNIACNVIQRFAFYPVQLVCYHYRRYFNICSTGDKSS